MTDQIQMLLQTMLEVGTRADASRRSHLVVEFVLMSFLVDAKIATIDQICQRVDVVLQGMPDQYQVPDVVQRMQLVKDWLRHYERKPTERWTPEIVQGERDRPSTDDPELTSRGLD